MTDPCNPYYLHDCATSIFDRLLVPATAYSVPAHLLDDRPRSSAHRSGDASLPAHTSCTPVFLDVIDKSHCLNFDSCISTIRQNVDINDIYVLFIHSEKINDASIKQLVMFYFQYVEPCRNNNVLQKNTSWKLVIDKILNDTSLYYVLLRYVFRAHSMTYRQYHAIVGNIVSENTVRKYIIKSIYKRNSVYSECNTSTYYNTVIVQIDQTFPENPSIKSFDIKKDEFYDKSKTQHDAIENDAEDLCTADRFECGKMLFDRIKNEFYPNILDCDDIVNHDNWNNENLRELFIARINQYSDNEKEMYDFINTFISGMTELGKFWIYK